MTVGPRDEHRQRGHRVRLEWGLRGVELLAADCAVVVVVDVLSFCTSVDVALGHGAAVLPQRVHDPAGARARGAEPAGLFLATHDRGLREVLGGPASGRELVADGFGADVDLAAELDASAVVPRMRDGFLGA